MVTRRSQRIKFSATLKASTARAAREARESGAEGSDDRARLDIRARAGTSYRYRPWKPQEKQQLMLWRAQGVRMAEMAVRLDRSLCSVENKLYKLDSRCVGRSHVSGGDVSECSSGSETEEEKRPDA